MAETGTSLAYRALVSSLAMGGSRIVDSRAVSSVAKSLGFHAASMRGSLVRGGYLLPVHFKGIYYLPDPDELGTRYQKMAPFEIVAAACSRRFGRNWYYGLGSSLYFGGTAHQTPGEFFIITDRHLPCSFAFGGCTFRMRRSGARDYSLEVKERGMLRFSSPARAITDYLYFHSKEGRRDYGVDVARRLLSEFPEAKGRLNKGLTGIYPRPYDLAVARGVGMACHKVRRTPD